MQHREEALRQQPAGASDRPDNRAGEGRKLQGGIYSRQQERGEEWGDLMEEDYNPELSQASGAPQIKNPKVGC